MLTIFGSKIYFSAKNHSSPFCNYITGSSRILYASVSLSFPFLENFVWFKNELCAFSRGALKNKETFTKITVVAKISRHYIINQYSVTIRITVPRVLWSKFVFLSKVPCFYSIHWSFIVWDIQCSQISCVMPIYQYSHAYMVANIQNQQSSCSVRGHS